jgi:AcrR family transcriptional regulator
MVYRKTSRVRAQLADKRGRILSAARHLVSAGGFGEASIDSIAAHAGVATGTVYRYFASKNELLAEVVRDASHYELEIIKAVRASRASAREKLSKAIEAFMMRAIRGRRLAYVLVVEPMNSGVGEVRLHYRRALIAVIAQIIAEGVRTHEWPRQDPQVAAAAVAGAMVENLVPILCSDAASTSRRAPRTIKRVTSFCLHALAGGSPL